MYWSRTIPTIRWNGFSERKASASATRDFVTDRVYRDAYGTSAKPQARARRSCFELVAPTHPDFGSYVPDRSIERRRFGNRSALLAPNGFGAKR